MCTYALKEWATSGRERWIVRKRDSESEREREREGGRESERERKRGVYACEREGQRRVVKACSKPPASGAGL